MHLLIPNLDSIDDSISLVPLMLPTTLSVCVRAAMFHPETLQMSTATKFVPAEKRIGVIFFNQSKQESLSLSLDDVADDVDDFCKRADVVVEHGR